MTPILDKTPIAKWMRVNAPAFDSKFEAYRWLAGQIGVTEFTARRYLLGERMPSPESMRAIAKLTHYEVTANTYFGIKPPVLKRAA